MRLSNALREPVIRGTADFPFSRYRITKDQAGPVITKLHWHPEFEFLYVHKGCVEVQNGDSFLLLKEGDISFISPQQLHSIRAVTAPIVYDAFVFQPFLIDLPGAHFFSCRFLRPLQEGQLLLPLQLSRDDSAYRSIRNALDRICDAQPQSSEYAFHVLPAVMEICSTLFPLLQPNKMYLVQKNHDVIKACLNMMEENYSTHLTLQELADQVHLHPNYLCSLFKKQTGQTIFQALLQIRIEKAAKLLQGTNLSVQQTAEHCGFESACAFSTKFRAHFGCSPSVYRKGIRHTPK